MCAEGKSGVTEQGMITADSSVAAEDGFSNLKYFLIEFNIVLNVFYVLYLWLVMFIS